jgi:cytochrome c-type biogenesis protein CcmH
VDEFTLVATALLLLAVVFVVLPFIGSAKRDLKSRRQINAVLFKSRLDELTQERDSGDLTEDEFQRLKIESQRRLLEDTDLKEEQSQKVTSRPWTVAAVLVVFVPLLSWFIYGQTGAKADWEIAVIAKQARQASAAGQDSTVYTRQLTEKLNAILRRKPDDPHYLMLLGSTEMSLQNFAGATGAYQRMAAVMPSDPSVLAQYAQALYLSSDRQMTAQVSELVDRTLALQPNQPTVLGMLGISSFEKADYQAAIEYWQRLLPSLGPVSPNAKMIHQGIEQAKKLLSQQTGEAPAPSATAETGTAVATPASLQVNVSLDKDIKAEANALVFVYARAVAGPRMPLAVARLTVADLPASITLDDSMAMAPNLKLSSFSEVEVIARVSKKGIANRGSGDIEGVIGPVVIKSNKSPLTLSINTVLP